MRVYVLRGYAHLSCICTYNRPCIMSCSVQDNEYFVFSKAHFLEHLEQFRNEECYKFAPN